MLYEVITIRLFRDAADGGDGAVGFVLVGIGAADNSLNEAVRDWLAAMTKLHDCGASLAGFIDRPMRNNFV